MTPSLNTGPYSRPAASPHTDTFCDHMTAHAVTRYPFSDYRIGSQCPRCGHVPQLGIVCTGRRLVHGIYCVAQASTWGLGPLNPCDCPP